MGTPTITMLVGNSGLTAAAAVPECANSMAAIAAERI